MDNEFPRSPRRDAPEVGQGRRRHYNPLMIFGIAVFGVIAFYLGLVVITHADHIFFPGNELKIGFIPSVPGVDTGNNPASADIKDRINILVMGLDQRRDEADNEAYRTDTVMILTIDPFSKTAGAFSIPRDTLVQIPDGSGGYQTDRINVAYEEGQFTYKNYPGGGPGLLKDTIEHNFGIPIDNYAILNFNSFIDIINDLGGIDVNVPEYAYDAAYSDCNRCRLYPVEFDPGVEHMDGERALAYARIRKSDSDFKRIERQQLVLKTVAKKASDLGVLLGSNPLNLYKKYKESVQTDISDLRVAGLALLAKQIGPDNIRTVSMAPATYPCGYCPASVLLWDKDKMEELKGQVFSDGRLQSESASVQVLNGTSTPDLGGQFASFMKGMGIGSEQISVDEYASGKLYDNTMIIDVSGKTYTTDRLAEWLHVPKERVLSGSDPLAASFANTQANVVVVLGADAKVPDAAAVAQTGG